MVAHGYHNTDTWLPQQKHMSTQKQSPNTDSTLPSTCASWRQSGMVGVLTAEILDEFIIQVQTRRYPGALLWTVALPVDQKLEPSSPAPDIQQLPDCKSRAPVNDTGWGGPQPVEKGGCGGQA